MNNNLNVANDIRELAPNNEILEIADLVLEVDENNQVLEVANNEAEVGLHNRRRNRQETDCGDHALVAIVTTGALGGLITGIVTGCLMKDKKIPNPFNINPYWWIGIDYLAGSFTGALVGSIAKLCIAELELHKQKKKLKQQKNKSTQTLALENQTYDLIISEISGPLDRNSVIYTGVFVK